jgi:hypothetical protein
MLDVVEIGDEAVKENLGLFLAWQPHAWYRSIELHSVSRCLGYRADSFDLEYQVIGVYWIMGALAHGHAVEMTNYLAHLADVV